MKIKKCKIISLILLVCLLVSIFFSRSVDINAKDNQDIYGDGVTSSWSDIASLLPSPYNKTRYIYVNNSGVNKQFEFNVEMYIDKGMFVYGDVKSTSFIGYTNDFKVVNNGYFLSSDQNNGLRGEYRYLGLTISGTIYTNSYFPADTSNVDSSSLVIIKYDSLPSFLKYRYGVSSDGNYAYREIKSLIDDVQSPAWDFINVTSYGNVVLRNKFLSSNLSVSGNSCVSIFDYCLINGWGNGGGSLKAFYQSTQDKEVYRYATYTGVIKPYWQKKFPDLFCNITIENQENIFTVNMPSDVNKIYVNVKVSGIFRDNYINLSEPMKRIIYNRDDVLFYKNYLDGNEIEIKEIVKYPDYVSFVGIKTIEVNRENVVLGINDITFSGECQVNAGGAVYSNNDTIILRVIVSEKQPLITPSPVPTETKTSEPLPVQTPIPSDIIINRRW